MVRNWILSLSILLATAAPGLGQIIVPGADGSDGAFNPGTGTTTVNLANSPTAAWDAPNPDAGTPLTGVYDPDKFAVVFRYSSVNIPAGALVEYWGHSTANPPVVWLVSGNVTIAGTLHLNGNNGHPAIAPGTAWGNVGGFRGGLGNQDAFTPQSAGYGPGGTRFVSTQGPLSGTGAYGGSHGTVGLTGYASPGAGVGSVYGNAKIVPLLGGSGGAGYMRVAGVAQQGGGGGAGGGAILIAATGTIAIAGSGIIRANGGNGTGDATSHAGGSGGSGGAIRLIAHQLNGPASSVTANGGSGAGNGDGSSGAGGAGRIRFEYNSGTDIPFSSPPASHAIVGAAAQIWPSATHPTVRIVSIGGAACPADPRANMGLPADVSLSQPFPVPVIIEAANVPLDWNVRLRTVPIRGQDILSDATLVSGDATLSTWQVQVQLTNGFSIMQARASAP